MAQLYVHNLPHGISETELKQIFAQSGCQGVRLTGSGSNDGAIVDFPSEQAAKNAKTFYSGWCPPGSTGPGLQLDFYTPAGTSQQPFVDPRAGARQRQEERPPADPRQQRAAAAHAYGQQQPQPQPQQQQLQPQQQQLLDMLSQNMAGMDPATLSQSFNLLQGMLPQAQAQQQQQQPSPPPQPQPQPQTQFQPQPQMPSQQQQPTIPQPPSQSVHHRMSYDGAVTASNQAYSADPAGHAGPQVPPPPLGGHASFSESPGSGNVPGLQLPPEASPTLFVEGVPKDATKREVAHIFRPFQGFQSARLVQRESRQRPGENIILCFAEFDNAQLATIAMHTLQGYVIDREEPDSNKLRLSYARNKASGQASDQQGQRAQKQSKKQKK